MKRLILNSKLLTGLVLFFYKKWIGRKKKVSFGKNSFVSLSTVFEGYNALGKDTDITNCHIGYASYISENTILKHTMVGKFSSIGPHVKCIFGNHPSHTFVSTHPAFFSKRQQNGFTFVDEDLFQEFADPVSEDMPYSITIGNDVWIGASVLLLDGITIGDGAIVAAGALVNKDVPPYTIVGGIPAKPIKKRFSEEQIEFLLNFKWWNRPHDWIRTNAHYFTNVDSFVHNFFTSKDV